MAPRRLRLHSTRVLRVVALTALVLAMIGAPVNAKPVTQNNNTSEKLRAAVTLAGVRSHQAALQDIADAAGGNRFAGLEGHANSAKYVFDQLTAAGYNPTY